MTQSHWIQFSDIWEGTRKSMPDGMLRNCNTSIQWMENKLISFRIFQYSCLDAAMALSLKTIVPFTCYEQNQWIRCVSLPPAFKRILFSFSSLWGRERLVNDVEQKESRILVTYVRTVEPAKISKRTQNVSIKILLVWSKLWKLNNRKTECFNFTTS